MQGKASSRSTFVYRCCGGGHIIVDCSDRWTAGLVSDTGIVTGTVFAVGGICYEKSGVCGWYCVGCHGDGAGISEDDDFVLYQPAVDFGDFSVVAVPA